MTRRQYYLWLGLHVLNCAMAIRYAYLSRSLASLVVLLSTVGIIYVLTRYRRR